MYVLSYDLELNSSVNKNDINLQSFHYASFLHDKINQRV